MRAISVKGMRNYFRCFGYLMAIFISRAVYGGIGGMLFICWLSWFHPVYGQAPLLLTPDAQFEFADSLYKHREFGSAKSEFEKFIFFFPGDSRVERAHFNIAMSLFYLKDYENASTQFRDILKQYGLSDIGLQSGLMLSRCQAAQKNLPAAIDTLASLRKQTDHPPYLEKIYYQTAWLYVEAGDFKNAISYFHQIKTAFPSAYPVDSIMDEMHPYPNIPMKSPLTAGIFSIMPGAGYAYCGRYKDAWISFVINGACMAAAWESFDKDLPVLGAIISVVGIGFYGGNIYGGISSAHKYNQSAKNAFITRLKNQFNVDLSTGVDSDGITVKVQRHF